MPIYTIPGRQKPILVQGEQMDQFWEKHPDAKLQAEAGGQKYSVSKDEFGYFKEDFPDYKSEIANTYSTGNNTQTKTTPVTTEAEQASSEDKPGFLGSMANRFAAGATEAFGSAANLVNKIAGSYNDAVNYSNGLSTNTYKDNPLAQVGKEAKETAEEYRQTGDYYNGKGFTELFKEGRPFDAAGSAFLSATESLPQSLAIAMGGKLGLLAAFGTTASDKYDQLKEEYPEMPEWKAMSNALWTGASEALTEVFGAGTIGRTVKGLLAKGGKKEAADLVKKSFLDKLAKAEEKHWLIMPAVSEFSEESANALSEWAVDKMTGVQRDDNILMTMLDAGMAGAMGGVQFSPVIGAAKFQNNRIKNKVTKEFKQASDQVSGFLPDDQKAILIDGLHQYQVNNDLDNAQKFVDEFAQNMGASQEQYKMIVDLARASVGYNNYVDYVNDQIDQETKKRIDEINSLRNPEMGSIVQAKMGEMDDPVYIVGGTLAYKDDMSIDVDNSSDIIYFVDANGKTQQATPQSFSALVNDFPLEQAYNEAYNLAKTDVIQREEAGDASQFAPGQYVIASNGVAGQVQSIDEEGNVIVNSNGITNVYKPEDLQIMQEQAQPTMQQDVQQEQAPAFPMDKDGNIDFGQISDPQQFADGLKQEFGDGGTAIIDQYIANEQAKLAKTSKAGDPIKAARDKANAQAKLDFYNQVKGAMGNEMGLTGDQNPINPIPQGEEYQSVAEFNANNGISENPIIPQNQTENPIEQGAVPNDTQVVDNGIVNAPENPINPTEQEPAKQPTTDDVVADILDGELDDQEVDDYVAENKRAAQNALTVINNKKPKMSTNKADYLAKRAAWQQEADAAQAEVDRWNEIGAKIAETRKGIGADEVARILSQTEPMTGHELAAKMLADGSIKLTHDSFKRETGGGTGEARGFFGLFARPEKGGVNIERAGEILMLADLEAGTNFFDQNDPNAGRNAIIDVLSEARTRGDLINYIRNNREEQARREQEAQYNAYAQQIMDEYHMSPDEYEAYERLSEEAARMMTPEQQAEIDGEIYDQIMQEQADEAERMAIFDSLNNNKENGTTETEGDSGTAGGVQEESNGGNEVLPGQQVSDTGRGEVLDKQGDEPVSDNAGQDGGTPKSEAERIKDAEKEVDQNPTDAQKEAGIYKKGHVSIKGFDISIENPAGSIRSGVDAAGKRWENKMNNTYGYFKGTQSVDGDHIDVYLSNDMDSWSGENVYVIDQYNPDGSFDEHKVMFGFDNADEALNNFLANYEKGWGDTHRLDVTPVSMDGFKKWIDSSHRKTKPFAEYSSIKDKPSIEEMNQYGNQEEGKNISNATNDTVSSNENKNNGGKVASDKSTQTDTKKDKIVDVGEKIGGARKDIVRATADKINLSGETFSKILPKFDYEKLIKSGLDPKLASGLKFIYDHAKQYFKNNKKRIGESKALDQMRFIANYAKGYLLGDTSVDYSNKGWVFTDYGKELYMFNTELYNQLHNVLGDEMFNIDLGGMYVDVVPENNKIGPSINYYRDGKRIDAKYIVKIGGQRVFTKEEREEAIKYFIDRVEKSVNYEKAHPYKLAIYYNPNEKNSYYVGAKIHGKVVALTPKGKEYNVKYLEDHNAELQAEAERIANEDKNKNKETSTTAKIYQIQVYENGKVGYAWAAKIGGKEVRVSDAFLIDGYGSEAYKANQEQLNSSQAQAQEKADQLLADYNEKKGWKPEMNIGAIRNRVGIDYRNGKDVSAKELMDKFGFRGVEFGNYVNQKERQKFLNECYDALMDMSEILGISPRAVSIDGNLALAIGSRGIGGAKAHYEFEKNVINLTKSRSAGTIAHEWWHALDFYFGNKNVKYPATSKLFDAETRKEMRDAINNLMYVIEGSDYYKRSNALDGYTNRSYYATDTELAARAFQDYITKKLIDRSQINDFLSHFTVAEDWNGKPNTYPYPTGKEAEDMRNAFDEIFSTIQEKEVDGHTVLFQKAEEASSPSYKEKVLRDALNDIIRQSGIEVIDNTEEGQRMLDEANGKVNMQAKINALDKAARIIQNWISKGSRSKGFTIELPESTGNMIRGALGRNVDSHLVTANNIAHAKKNHGVGGNKITDKSIPLRDEDFELLPYIITAPTRVERGSTDINGRESIRFIKEISNGNVLVVEKEQKNSPDDMETITMWAEKSSSNVADALSSKGKSPAIDARDVIISTEDAAKIRKDAENAIRNDEKIRQQKVYHGSGADFNAFDSSHMGEGEGNQSYGWGTYVTEVEGIARTYAKTNNSSLRKSKLESDIRRLKEALPFRKGEAKQEGEEELKRLEDELSKFNNGWSSVLYTVEIPDNNGDNYLNWEDGSITNKQYQMWYEAMKILGEEGSYDNPSKVSKESLDFDAGSEITRLGRKHSPEDVSKALSKAGFTGISYPAQYRSGGRNDGKRNYVIFNDNDAKITEKVRFFRTQSGEAYGYTVNGKIYIDPRIATSETPIHEYAHIWASAIRKGNPKEWDNIVGLMKGTDIWNSIQDQYPELTSEDEIADEVLAQYSGKRGAAKLRAELDKIAKDTSTMMDKVKAMAAIQNVRDALNKFWKGVADFLHIKYKSAEEVADRVMSDLLNSVNPMQMARKKYQLEIIKETNPMMDDYHTGIRSTDDILTLKEAVDQARADGERGGWSELSAYQDVKNKTLEDALEEGFITVYSSYPIQNGTFVTPSRMQAEEYAGGGKVYKKKVNIDDVAWISTDEGQLAKINNDTVGDTNTRYQFIGEQGASNMDKAEEANIRLDNLSIAREMEKANKDAKSIKLATGWERGADGKWRYEIPDGKFDRSGELHPERRRLPEAEQKELDDSEMELLEAFEKGSSAYTKGITENTDMADIYEAGGMERKKAERLSYLEDKRDRIAKEPKRLDDYLESKELFDAYPYLRETVVDTSNEGDVLFGKLGSYDPSTNVLKLNDRSHSTLIHEVQHAIQNIEGFESGSNPQYIGWLFNEAKKEFKARRFAEQLEDKRQELGDGYSQQQIHDELVKELSEAGMPYVPRSVQEKAFNYWVRGYANKALDNAIKAFDLENNPQADFDPQRWYKKVGGEVEARNSQSRMNMTPEERRASLASETEDVAREDQVFLADRSNAYDAIYSEEYMDDNLLYREVEDIISSAKADGTYMKAPNGKPSNLTPRQWAQVRTKAFKDWFGDWELASKVLHVVPALKEHGFNNFDEARSWAKENIARTLTNDETGGKGEIRISNTAVAKFLSESAVAKSDSRDVHLSVLKVLPDVIRDSVDAEQHPDYKKGDGGKRSVENGVNNDVIMHRLYGAVSLNDKIYRVKITLKENVRTKETPKAYSYEATKIELLAGQHGDVAMTSPRNSNNSITAANLLQNVEKSYGNGIKLLNSSKFVDENGEPMVVYHGSGDTFTVFSPQSEWHGNFFSSERSVAESYSPTADNVVFEEKKRPFVDVKFKDGRIERQYYDLGGIYNVYLDIKNPLVVDCKGKNWNDIHFEGIKTTTDHISDYALKQGYDGVIFMNLIDGAHRGLETSNTFVAFNPNQIKSATDNVGTFDAGNADIRYRESDSQGSVEKENLSEAGQSFAESLGVADQVEFVTDKAELQGKRASAKGFFDRKTGKVTVVVPNHTSVGDMQATILHELVGHYGLRKLFGDKFDDMMDRTFKAMPKELRRAIAEEAISKYRGDVRTATEEYLASIAERGVRDMKLWEKIKAGIKDFFRSIGINLTMRDEDIAYMLWRSKNRLKASDTMLDVAQKIADDADMQSLLYRDGMGFGSMLNTPKVDRNGVVEISEWLKERLKNRSAQRELYLKVREGYQDNMIRVREWQREVERETGHKVQDHEDFYTFKNQTSSRAQFDMQKFHAECSQVIWNEIDKLAQKIGKPAGEGTRMIENYEMVKHGLERNAYMRQQAIDQLQYQATIDIDNAKATLKGKPLQDAIDKITAKLNNEVAKYENKDYSGLTALSNEILGSDKMDEAALSKWVDDFEKQYDTMPLWRAIREATNRTLQQQLRTGLISKETYDKISGMYKFYIPLKDWDGTRAQDLYEYENGDRDIIQNPLKHAKGRTTRAGNILANIASAYESATILGYKNLANQRLLNFVRNSGTQSAVASEQWFIKSYDAQGNEYWQPAYASGFNEDPDHNAKVIADFEADMKQKQEQGLAKTVHEVAKLGVPVKAWQEQQHIVKVKEGGVDKTVYFLGDPRVSQAVNGLNNRNYDMWLIRQANNVRKFMMLNYTSRNVTFILRNLLRDISYVPTMSYVKYGWDFTKKYVKWLPKAMKDLAKAEYGGKADPEVVNFYKNGGATGYLDSIGYERYKKEIDSLIKASEGKDRLKYLKKIFAAVGMHVERVNNIVENANRYAVYRAAKESGFSELKAIEAAKEASVNFNRRGSGQYGGAIAQNAYFFFNAAIQGTQNFGSAVANNKVRALKALGFWFALGVAFRSLSGLFGDDDDEYNQLPDYVRQNNLVIPLWKGQYLSIPLSIEIRAVYGLGDMIAQAFQGGYDDNKMGFVSDALLKLMDLAPISIEIPQGRRTSEEMAQSIMKNFVPDAAKPVYDVIFTNENFYGKRITGRNEYNTYIPEWQKASFGTSKALIEASKKLNEATGGDYATKGWADGLLTNPAVAEYLFEQYLGGVGKAFGQAYKTVEAVATGDKVYSRNIPIVSGLTYSTENMVPKDNTSKRYSNYIDDFNEAQSRYKQYQKGVANGEATSKQFTNFVNSPEFMRYQIIGAYKKQVDGINDMRKALDPDDPMNETLAKYALETKRQMIERLKEMEE